MVTERIIIEDTSQIDLKKLEKAAAILREGGLEMCIRDRDSGEQLCGSCL